MPTPRPRCRPVPRRFQDRRRNHRGAEDLDGQGRLQRRDGASSEPIPRPRRLRSRTSTASRPPSARWASIAAACHETYPYKVSFAGCQAGTPGRPSVGRAALALFGTASDRLTSPPAQRGISDAPQTHPAGRRRRHYRSCDFLVRDHPRDGAGKRTCRAQARSRERQDHVLCRRLRLLSRDARPGRQDEARRRLPAAFAVRHLLRAEHLAAIPKPASAPGTSINSSMRC